LFILTVICFQTTSHAQTLNTVQNGSAQWMGIDGLAPWATNKGDDCYQITPGQPGQSGAVWYNHPIDFSNSFTISYQAFFGVGFIDGADGMALVFKRDNSNVLGSTGEGIGYGGISPSVIFEFDTYWNSGKGDPLAEPNEDHVAFNWMGNPNHNATASAFGGPASNFYRSVPNLEDNSFHEVKVVWESGPNLLKLYLDCELQLSIQGDFKQVAFGGDSSVYFGFVGSTGNQFNAQLVCFNSISFVEGLDIPDTTICGGQTVASINALIPSGTSYSWSPTTGVSNPNISNPTFTPTTTTTYTVSISDVCGDVTTEDVTINVNPNLVPSFLVDVDLFCVGDANPLNNTSLEGITGSWSPAFDNTTSGTYTFTPTAGQCATTATKTITVNPFVDSNFNAVADICDGDPLAQLPTTSNNGITGAWSPALDNTITTEYTFTPDGGQCANPANLTITVIQKTDPTFTAVADICDGDPLAQLPIISNNGVTGIWAPALDNTLTTVYTFTPTTGECANPTTLTITVIQKTDPTFTAVNDICNGDVLNPLPTTSNNGVNGTWTPALDNTLTTQYTFTPDAGECANAATLVILVNQKTDPTFAAVNDICNGAALDPLPTISNNGVNGTWSPILDNTLTTLYTFTPTAGLCANPTTLTITVNDQVDPLFTAVADICNGDILAPLATTSNNGITGSWNPALDNTLTTTYTFTPSPTECANPTTLTILVNQKVGPVFTPVDDICNGDVLAPLPTTSNDGITGTWSPTLDNTITTTYTFTPDVGECANPVTLTITVIQKVDSIFNPIGDICSGGPLVPHPTTSNNGITGTWSPALDNTITTLYTFTPDAGECANPATLTILVNQRVDPTFMAVGGFCNGAVLAPLPTTSNEGINGTWSPALDNTITTLYTFTPDPGECANPTTLTITVGDQVDPVFTPINDICNGEALAPLPPTSNNGITGTWNQAPSNTATAVYTFTPNAWECANPTTLSITVNPKVDPDFTPVNDICNGDVLAPLPTTSNDGIVGTWTPAVDNTLTTTYTFTPDPNECANPATLTIVVNQKVNPDFTPVDDICTGTVLAPLPTTSNNGVTGTWSPALDNTTTTLYTFTPDAGLCANPATLTILVIQKLDPTFDPINLICEGDLLAPLPTNSNQGIAGTWSPALDNTATGIYTFTPNAGECANPTNLTVTVIPNSISTFTQIDPICAGETITLLTQSNQGFNGSWSPAVDNTITTTYTFTADPGECADPTTMTVVVIPVNVLTISAINLSEEFDANQVISVTASGGSGSYEYQLDGGDWQFSSIFEYVIGCDEHTVAVRDAIDNCNTQPETTVAIMEFPKFFTPNGDGYNDTWNIKCFLDDPFAMVRLSDRYGKLLYEFKPSLDSWDGSFNGEMLPSTDYWFVVTYINSSGVETQYKSHFSLRR
jgi:gliding motility-associated-like protein